MKLVNLQLLLVFLPVAILSCDNDTGDGAKVMQLAQDYTEAWNSGDPRQVASFYAADGELIINGGDPAKGRKALADVAQSFMQAFPDLQLTLDSLLRHDNSYRYYWTFKGTYSGPGGNGNRVHFSGFEQWTLNDEGLVQRSLGSFDAADYERQLMSK